MTITAVPRPILVGKTVLDKALHSASSWIDTAFHVVAQKVLKVRPAETTVDEELPEEVEWLESGRSQLAFRRDTLWAVPQMWWEMAFGGAGAGTYLLSRAAGSKTGMAAGLALGAGGEGILLLADLGRPERFPKVFAKPSTSWIARGSYAFSAFAAFGCVALISKQGSALHKVSGTVADTAALVLMTYDGLFLNKSKAVASWIPPLLPVLFAADAVKSGGALSSAFTSPSSRWLRNLTTVSAVTTAVLSQTYVSELKEGSTAARLSARDLTEADQKDRFQIDALAIGTLVPGLVSLAE